MLSVVEEVLIWGPNLLSQFELNCVLSPFSAAHGGGLCLSDEGLHPGNVNSSGAISPLTQLTVNLADCPLAHFCRAAEIHAGNSCSLVLVRKTSRRFFRRGKEQRRVVSSCQASAILEALARMIGGEGLMMAILSLKTDESI